MTDPLCKPFSMGRCLKLPLLKFVFFFQKVCLFIVNNLHNVCDGCRNLICVYSKKHMYDVPELAETKKRANLQSLKEMGLLLR